VRIQFLGTGDAFGSGGRFQACIHVDAGGSRFLLDCGASSLVAMKRFGAVPNDVDIVLVSHFHGDHFAGIPWLVLEGQFFGRTKPLLTAGPPGVGVRAREAMEALFQGSSETSQRFDYTFMDLEPMTKARVGPLGVTAYPVRHSGGSTPYGYRVEVEGKVLSYSGDTEWTDALLEVARGADLFICEANFFDKQVRNHVSYQAIAEHRAELDCKRLILTHLGPEMLARRSEVAFEVADDGLVIDL
jgi:ribonuclease BN (tRNA processing enzyme)